MKTEAIREALAQYLRCRLAVSAPQRSAQVRAALEELEALEAAQAPSRFANGPALSPDVARRISEQLGAKYPPACGFRSFVEDAQASAYPDAKVRTGPMCKAPKGSGDGYDICWREDGHREDHDFRPGVVATGAGSGGGLAAMSDWELAQKISTSRYVMEKGAPPAHVEGCCIMSPHEVPTMCMTAPRMGGR